VIDLPHGGGGRFSEYDLVEHIRAAKPPRDYIIQGQADRKLAQHPKHSLDCWLRKFSRYKDTKQAVNSVIDDLLATGLFVLVKKLRCPDSGSYCKGIRLA